ncbi:MAG: N-6 DNA methylase [Nitrospirota bacterium]
MQERNNLKDLVSKLWEAFQILRNSTGTIRNEAFKVIFALFAYKRFSDSDIIKMPENCRWDQLINHPADQFFIQLENNFNQLLTVNELPNIASVLNLRQFNDRVPDNIKEYLINIFNDMDLSYAKYFPDEVNEVVSEFFHIYFSQHPVDTFENKSLNRLSLGLLGTGVDEELYFPECGLGDIIIQAFNEHMNDKYLLYDEIDKAPFFNASGSVRNADIWAVVVLRLLLAGITRVDITNEDYFLYASAQKEITTGKADNSKPEGKAADNNEEIDLDIKRLAEELKKIRDRLFETYDSPADLIYVLPYLADVIFFISPFGFYLPSNIPLTISVKNHIFEISRNQSELFPLLWSLKHLYKKGRIGIVLPSVVLSKDTNAHKKVRELLVYEDLLEAIVQLPSGIFPNTNIKLALLIINTVKPREKKRKFAFMMVKATKKDGINVITNDSINKAIFVFNNFVSLSNDYIATFEEIRQQDFNLHPSRYMGSIAEEIKKLRRSKSGRQLGEISKVIRGTSTGVSGKIKGIPVITTKNLSGDVKDLYLNLDGVSFAEPEFSDQSTKRKCIIVSLVGDELKPTIFDPEILEKTNKCSEILLGKNVAAIFPAEGIVDFEYLHYQLNSSFIKTQFVENLARAGKPEISLPCLKQIIIPVLNKIEEQQSFAYQQKIELFMAEKAKYEALREILQIKDEKKETEFQIVKHLGHGLNRRIGNVESIMANLENFIDRKGLSTEPLQETYYEGQEVIIVKDKVSEALNDLRQMHRLIRGTRELVTKGKLTEKDFKLVDIGELFNSHILAKYRDHNFRINFNCPEGVKAFLHESSFIEAIDNIISNAEEHGFKNRDTGNEIFFWIHDTKDKIVIDYANNGEPFPSDINEDDFLEFGIKGKSSNGTGLGGAYVKLMLDAHNASFEIINKTKPYIDRSGEIIIKEDKGYLKYGVYFRITIPKRRSNEQEN